MKFEEALAAMREGKVVARTKPHHTGRNGRREFIIRDGSLQEWYKFGEFWMIALPLPGGFILADDWQIVEKEGKG